EDECGLEYFRVLQALDTEDRNACHDAIATLAAHHYLAAIVTTNFDRLIERALEAADVPYRVFYDSTHYEALPDVVASGFREPLPVIKVHGSGEVPESTVDTLRQRIKGRPEALERAIRALLSRHHVLFAGFSGADLAYDEGYLGLRAAAAENRSFTCLLRPGDKRSRKPGVPLLPSCKARCPNGSTSCSQNLAFPSHHGETRSRSRTERPPWQPTLTSGPRRSVTCWSLRSWPNCSRAAAVNSLPSTGFEWGSGVRPFLLLTQARQVL
ncbi:MAG TPA: SIR2 family protein, partial [Candidatus Binatia bacterium]|nr:SIR2 family protein [Candidatus Binatia bacterium]